MGPPSHSGVGSASLHRKGGEPGVAAAEKVIVQLAAFRMDDLDLEYTTGRTWIKQDQISGMDAKPDDLRYARSFLQGPGMVGSTSEPR